MKALKSNFGAFALGSASRNFHQPVDLRARQTFSGISTGHPNDHLEFGALPHSIDFALDMWSEIEEVALVDN